MNARTRARRKATDADRKAWYIAHGICVACGQRDAFNGRQKCPECLEKQTLNNIKYRSIEVERSYYARKKEKRIERIFAGLCPNCGKPKKIGLLCGECYAKRKIKYERERKERCAHGDPRRIRKMSGKCWFCENAAMRGKKVCEHHYTDLMHRKGFAQRGGESHQWRMDEQIRIASMISRNG